jgi:hypothetical protein
MRTASGWCRQQQRGAACQRLREGYEAVVELARTERAAARAMEAIEVSG